MSTPVLSVIVTIVDGGEALGRCLEALDRQDNPPGLEIIVPYDESAAYVSGLAPRFPTTVFLPMGAAPTVRPTQSAAGQTLVSRPRPTRISGTSNIAAPPVGVRQPGGKVITERTLQSLPRQGPVNQHVPRR